MILYITWYMENTKRNNILNFLGKTFKQEYTVNPARIFEYNSLPEKGEEIIYLCEREIRVKDNFALQFAIQKSQEAGAKLKIIHPKQNYMHRPKSEFITAEIEEAKTAFTESGFNFEIIPSSGLKSYLSQHEKSTLIIDFNPTLNRNYLKSFAGKIYEIDGHNIVPARFVSDKQEYSAATIRKKIYNNIYAFLTEPPHICDKKNNADLALEEFIKEKLDSYFVYRNDPSKNAISNLSKYINLGFISSQRIALEVIKSNTSDENKEAFLEELIIRKELADNFCLYNKNFKNINGIPNWAKTSLKNHKKDIRNYIYSKKELDNAETHDRIWNASQTQLMQEGKIHGYLRMYWAKKILEWSYTPEIAIKTAIYLNDKYSFDSPGSNGYVGILWAIGGLHDRAFKDYYITGKIRRMTYNSTVKKFPINDYIKNYNFNYKKNKR